MTKRFPRSASLLLALGLLPLQAVALDVEPSVTVGEVYTSNVELAPSGLEESEWITRVAPAVTVSYMGPRLDLSLDYTLEALFYVDNSDRNEVWHQLATTGLLDLIGEDLQLRGTVSISQVNLSPSDPVSNSNVNTTGNRGDAYMWEAGPQWQRDLFGGSEIDGFLTVGSVNFDDPDDAGDPGTTETQDIDTVSGRVSLHTDGSTDPTITYELAYEYDKLDYQNSGDAIVETAYLELGYRLNPNWRVFGMYGLDSNFALDSSLDESRWEAGVEGTFTSDSFRISTGHRYFGSTYGVDWQHVANNFTFGLGYSEGPSTTDLVALRELPTEPVDPNDPNTPPPTTPPDSDINRPGNPTRFIYKRADADLAWTLYRTILSLNLFWEDREDQVLITDDDELPTSVDDETSYGFDVNLSWELGSRTSANAGGGWRHRDFNDVPDNVGDPIPSESDELTTLQAGIDYALGLRTSLAFQTGYRSRTNNATLNTPSDSSGDYDEFWASAQLVRTFR